jgi:hypothetical protein
MNPPLRLRVAHHHPGRLRLRSRAFAGDGAVEQGIRARAEHALRELGGVRGVAAAPLTGSVLVTYDPETVGPDALVDAAARAADLVVAEPTTHAGDEERLVHVVIDVARELNTFTSELTGHRADLRTLVPATLAGAGVYSFVAGSEARLPRWDTLFYWAYSVFTAVNQREIDEEEEQGSS